MLCPHYLPNAHTHSLLMNFYETKKHGAIVCLELCPGVKSSALEIDILSTPPPPPRRATRTTLPKQEFGRPHVSSTCSVSESGQAGVAREEAMMSVVYSFTCVIVLAVLTGLSADGSVPSKPEKVFSRPLRREQEVKQEQQLNISALNTVLAFETYRDLATRATTGPGVQQQHNILFSPLGLASALALLSQISGSESRSQALEALGLAANSTEQSVEATISALADLQHNLMLQEGGGGVGVQRAESGAGSKTKSGIGATAGGAAGNNTGVGDGAKGRNGTSFSSGGKVGVHGGSQLRVWSSLHVDGRPSLDYDSFLSRPQHTRPSIFNISFEALMKDLKGSNKLKLNNYVYFKGRQPFERRHTVPRRFQLNATTSVEVEMMFRDDSSEVMMLYDTNCSVTVVQLARSERLASLLLLPKAELQPLEDCLSDSRMNFWLSNLKAGRAEIRFPKFQLRKSYSLDSLLRNSGVSSIFSDSADFSRISQKMLKLVKAPHEVLLEVEETKSGEGGSTDITLDFSVPPRITFDRPFMLIIYDDLTGLVLLMGRILDPTDV
ncbi:alpha-1-antiproteinase-like [Thunnus albacares]|uniref:alpha-1-antiproteinase-like n=1 Tax=Thunnus albacares TaxID=8236 RepID=UPI001CF61FBB|nr:alpha-1-antiproteinase-like [Thunnus albacares]